MSTDTIPTPAFTPETTLGEIVAARPATARLFERLQLDYCCGGRRTLTEACARRGLDAATVLALIEADAAPARDEVDAAAMTLTALADHIETTHHAYVKAELPRLHGMAVKVATKHGWRDARLPEVAGIVENLVAEMFSHMEKEERILFPFVRQIESGAQDSFHCGSIANPIHVMEAEHEHAGQAVARLCELTDGFRPQPDDCNTHRALLAGLAEFEQDLHRHVHKENNILFPRALARATTNR